MAVTITVNGVDRTAAWDRTGELSYEDLLNGRNTLRVRLFDRVGGFRPEDGQEVIVLEDGTRRFGGMLVEPEEYEEPGTGVLRFDTSAVDFSAIADRHLVARVYEHQTLKAIVLDIVAQDLAGEGLDTSGVETGPTIDKAVFNWVPASQAFNELSELAGMAWWVDASKVLHVRERTSIAAPAPLDGSTALLGTVRVRPNREQYRNRQIVRGGTDLTDARTESFVGDSKRRTFTTSFKVGKVPTVEVNSVSKTVGIRGVDTGKDWYWSKGTTEISQDTVGGVLSASDVVEVTYQGMFQIIVDSRFETEVTARQAIEGGSGIYARVENRPSIDSAAMATEVAHALLTRYGSIARVLTCRTRIPGFAAGQLVAATFPAHGITGELYLIDSLSAAVNEELDEIWYTVNAIAGDPYGGWQAYFRRLAQAGRQFVLHDDEIVVILRSLADEVTAAARLTAVSAVPETRAGYALAGFSVAG